MCSRTHKAQGPGRPWWPASAIPPGPLKDKHGRPRALRGRITAGAGGDGSVGPPGAQRPCAHSRCRLLQVWVSARVRPACPCFPPPTGGSPAPPALSGFRLVFPARCLKGALACGGAGLCHTLCSLHTKRRSLRALSTTRAEHRPRSERSFRHTGLHRLERAGSQPSMCFWGCAVAEVFSRGGTWWPPGVGCERGFHGLWLSEVPIHKCRRQHKTETARDWRRHFGNSSDSIRETSSQGSFRSSCLQSRPLGTVSVRDLKAARVGV